MYEWDTEAKIILSRPGVTTPESYARRITKEGWSRSYIKHELNRVRDLLSREHNLKERARREKQVVGLQLALGWTHYRAKKHRNFSRDALAREAMRIIQKLEGGR